jgi:2-dehydro-3-deoxyglucarate aldolase
MRPIKNHADVAQKIRTGRLTIGGWLSIGNPSVAEILAAAGFDWLAIDMEHTVIDFAQAQSMMQAIELHGVVPLVRVAENHPTFIKRVMDAGAAGVIVPMVNCAADAEAAVAAVKYPPQGRRGVGLARAQGYGMDFDAYRRRINKDSIVIVQIEHIDALSELDQIFSVPGVDAYMIGPYDLSASTGRPGEFNHPEVQKALNEVWRVGRAKGITAGVHVVHPNPKDAVRFIKKGYRLLTYGVDQLFLAHAAKDGLAAIRKGQR